MAEACPDDKLARSFPAHHDDYQTAFDSLGHSIKSPLGTRLSLGSTPFMFAFGVSMLAGNLQIPEQ